MNQQTSQPRLDAIVHTPGPWQAKDYRVCGFRNGRIKVICDTANNLKTRTEENAANAALIAAAPEMLAALRHLVAASAGVRCESEADAAMLREAMRPAMDVLEKLAVV